MEGTDAASFNFNASTRQITTKAGVTYDYETKSSYSVTIKAVNGGGIMLHARRPGGPVAAAQKCATHGPLSVATRGAGCTAWSSMRRFDWRLSTRV